MFKGIFLKTADFLIKANFFVAVIISICVALLALTNSSMLFEDSADLEDLYGPIASNLRLILVYLGLAQVNILFYCMYKQKQPILIIVGLFYFSMIGGFAIYGEINQIPIAPDYDIFLIYEGISHFLFGGFYLFIKAYRI